MLFKRWYSVVEVVDERATQTLFADFRSRVLQHNFEAFQHLPKLGILFFRHVLVFNYPVDVKNQLRLGNHFENFGLKFLLLFGEWIHKDFVIELFTVVVQVQTLDRVPDLAEQFCS